MEIITYKGKRYPKIQAEGNAAQYIIPFAKKFCKGIGYDVGCNKVSWSFPGSYPVDPNIDERYHAMKLPNIDIYDPESISLTTHEIVDYIFSSHCLEHVMVPWFDVLRYWTSKIKVGGTLFLYLPDYSQEYWRPWNNLNHKSIFTPSIMKDAFEALGYVDVFVSGVDLLNSFAIVGEKGNDR